MTAAMDVPVMTPGIFMRIARDFAELTQRELAEKLGVDVSTVQRCEDGRSYPRQERIIAWAIACGIQPAWLQWNVDACSQPDMDFDLRPGGGGTSRPEVDVDSVVHPLGLEPRTHWFRASRADWELAA